MRRVMILRRKFEWKVNLYWMITAHKKQNLRHDNKHLKQTHSLKSFSVLDCSYASTYYIVRSDR